MVHLRRYIELYCAFDHIDSGDDNRIDFEVTIKHLSVCFSEIVLKTPSPTPAACFSNEFKFKIDY